MIMKIVKMLRGLKNMMEKISNIERPHEPLDFLVRGFAKNGVNSNHDTNTILAKLPTWV
jgi:hypothetical protein